jgi:hypothetical protein
MHYGEDPPVGLDIDHINRDKTDNRISNLRVVTHKENCNNTIRVLNSKAIVVKLQDGQEKRFSSVKEAAEMLNLHKSGINSVLHGHRKQTKGCTVRYA